MTAEITAIAPPELHAPAVDAARPWAELTGIWFNYRSAELSDLQAARLAEVVNHVAQHPGAEIGINRPADLSGVEPDNEIVNRQRVATIHDALIQAGIAPSLIYAGALESHQPASINRLVLVFAREAP